MPALVSSRAKPCVTRMPCTVSASADVTREKVSCWTREACRILPRKKPCTMSRQGTMASRTRNSCGLASSMSAAAQPIWPKETNEMKKLFWIPLRIASMSEIMRLIRLPWRRAWKNESGCVSRWAISLSRRSRRTFSPIWCARRMRQYRATSATMKKTVNRASARKVAGPSPVVTGPLMI